MKFLFTNCDDGTIRVEGYARGGVKIERYTINLTLTHQHQLKKKKNLDNDEIWHVALFPLPGRSR